MSKITKQKASSIEEMVMKRIKSGKIQVRPRSYYLSLSILGAIASLLLGFTLVYSISVASVWLRIIAAVGPAYGAKRNLATLVGTFPWWALLIGLISLVGLIYLIKKLGHMYKVRLVYLVLLIAALFIVLGFTLSYSNLPGLMNGGHRTDTVCGIDDVDCTINGRMYGRGQLMK